MADASTSDFSAIELTLSRNSVGPASISAAVMRLSSSS
jgi:hypothetical protein